MLRWVSPFNRVTAGQIGLRLGIQLLNRQVMSVGHFGVLQHMRMCTHRFYVYLENGWTNCADIWHVASGQLVMASTCLWGCLCTCTRARPTSISRERLDQGWNFGRFLVLLGSRRLYSLSGKYSPSILFPIEPEVPGTQSTRLRPQFHTESLISKPMA